MREHEGQFARNVVRKVTVNNAESSVLADFTKLPAGAEAHCRRSLTRTRPFSVIRSTSSWRNV